MVSNITWHASWFIHDWFRNQSFGVSQTMSWTFALDVSYSWHLFVDAMKMFPVAVINKCGRKSMKGFLRESLFESSPIYMFIEALWHLHGTTPTVLYGFRRKKVRWLFCETTNYATFGISLLDSLCGRTEKGRKVKMSERGRWYDVPYRDPPVRSSCTSCARHPTPLFGRLI